MMDSVFRRSNFFITAELHIWQLEFNCDGCTNSAEIYRWRIRLHMSCIHFNRGGVANDFAFFTQECRCCGSSATQLVAGTVQRTCSCLKPGPLLVGDTTPTSLCG
ncbi:hypothetical protein EVAR_23888_1 [Eumeta japonica]|uniref:Uncharacterized protein n=1 Tax=Eumeta variegata TaxID=151549 RepID=A0A4C1V5I3_EUMVA|nr:hypothetical protein EVAR_23888_1 [Eumeta japonica]